MYIVLGATGHVGSAVASTLLDRGEAVTVVTHDAAKAEPWRDRGAEVATVDVNDISALRDVLRRGRRAFLLNPPADPATDTDVVERRSAAAIAASVDGAGLEAVVAESTFGAQPGERIGDLSVLYGFEQALRAGPVPVGVIRAAYYMSNWDALLTVARETGTLPTPYPADLAIPMVAPDDLGTAAARLLTATPADDGTHYVEGPRRYSSGDVAAAFARALGRTVEVAPIPRDRWEDSFKQLGFSDAAAASYTHMTAVSIDGGFEQPDAAERGATTLDAYVAALVARDAG